MPPCTLGTLRALLRRLGGSGSSTVSLEQEYAEVRGVKKWALHFYVFLYSGGEENAREAKMQGAKSKAVAEPRFVPSKPESTVLRSITSTPPPLQGPFHTVFSPSFTFFNAMQSNLLDKIVCASESLAVSAPTGCGKTVIFEMAGDFLARCS
jgi:hypothetical protein